MSIQEGIHMHTPCCMYLAVLRRHSKCTRWIHCTHSACALYCMRLLSIAISVMHCVLQVELLHSLAGVHTEHQQPNGSIQTPSRHQGLSQIPTSAKQNESSSRQPAAAAAATACSSLFRCSLLLSCWASGCTLHQSLAVAKATIWPLPPAGTSPSL